MTAHQVVQAWLDWLVHERRSSPRTIEAYDRIARGYVIDYIHTLFIDFPIFNFADCLITCACFAVIIYLIFDLVRDRKKETQTRKESAPHD